ncbi:hypothetical protein [Leclercia adecarboxylata]|uniref:hypothetical protein n=1 Tax=Leclercia adecarboxylata TaxID=83655 RepID=UPI002948D0DF|nr:hypothetical protein [Leclercia adecarboxylata]MDV5280037.1 hypothetical protein [Leclercia adecarboxylata]
MFRLTCIDLDNGEFAVYLNNHYLGSEDGSGEKLYLGDVLERLSMMPGVQLQTIQQPVPDDEEWCWNDVGSVLTPSHVLRREMTVGGMMTRLQQYPQDALALAHSGLRMIFLKSMARLIARRLQLRWSALSTRMMRTMDLTGITCGLSSMR